jgi:hypothetical protein
MVTPNLPNYSTCATWAAPTDVAEAVDSSGAVLPSIDLPLLDLCLQISSDPLFSLSGRRFPGSCQDTVRPLPRYVDRDHGRPITPFLGTFAGGFWTSGWSEFGGGRAGWAGTINQEEMPDGYLIPSVDLGVFPLTGIVQVLIDGQVQDPTTYRIDDNRHLVRVVNPATNPGDTNVGWPFTQRVDLPSTEKDTWEVTFTYGTPPPPGGTNACAVLAWQLYLSNPSTAGACSLPVRTTRVTRQGVTATLLDPTALLGKQRTGIYLVDMWLQTVNPSGLKRASGVMSPDVGPRVRRTGPVGP